MSHSVAVILPVYKNVQLTKECISKSLPSILDQGGRLIIINDNSPEVEMLLMLSQFLEKNPEIITLVHNKANLGFTASVNTGLEIAGNTHVVLLNSDVLTPRKWLEVLLEESALDQNIGTITPFSNNSTITSFPIRNIGTSKLLEYDVDIINEAFETRLPLVYAPTGVGFCMFISAKCLNVVGKLDVERFGKGYGEENDFCQRAIKAGFLNAITPNLYCHHIGSVSFGSSAAKRMENASKVINRLHPRYHLDVSTWIQRDYLGPARLVRTIQVAKKIGRKVVLHINHALGGGTSKYLNALTAIDSEDLVHILVLGRRTKQDSFQLSLRWSSSFEFETFFISKPDDILALLQALPYDCVHIHHIAGFSAEILAYIRDEVKAPYIITFHDYYLIHGNPFLTDCKGEYVGITASPDDSPLKAHEIDPFATKDWSDECRLLIGNSSLNIFPSEDTYNRYHEAYGDIPGYQIVPHDNTALLSGTDLKLFAEGSELPHNIIILGALGKEKGADFLEKVALESFACSRHRLRFKILGFAYRKLRQVDETGPYREEELASMIIDSKAGCIFFTSRCPETYSYTLSQAICASLPIVAPNIGAFPERLQTYPRCLIYEMCVSPRQLAQDINHFLTQPDLHSGSREALRTRALQVNSFYRAEYNKFMANIKPTTLDCRPEAFYECISHGSCGLRRSSRMRGFIFAAALSIYKSSLLRPVIMLVPFKIVRKAKEWLNPFPINS